MNPEECQKFQLRTIVNPFSFRDTQITFLRLWGSLNNARRQCRGNFVICIVSIAKILENNNFFCSSISQICNWELDFQRRLSAKLTAH